MLGIIDVQKLLSNNIHEQRPSCHIKMSEMTMRAVVFKEPKKVALEERPMPRIENTTDIVVKVKYTALCGRCVIILSYSAERKKAVDIC